MVVSASADGCTGGYKVTHGSPSQPCAPSSLGSARSSGSAASDATDPAMPELIPATEVSDTVCEWEFFLGMDNVLQRAQVDAVRPSDADTAPDASDAPQQSAGERISEAASLLQSGDQRLRGITELWRVLDRWPSHPLATSMFLGLLRNADKMIGTIALTALNAMPAFPAEVAPDATELLMQMGGRSLPQRGKTLYELCHSVALSDPAAVLDTCLGLIPRQSDSILGFVWILEPLFTEGMLVGEDYARAGLLLSDDLGSAQRLRGASRLLRRLAAAVGGDALCQELEEAELVDLARALRTRDRIRVVLDSPPA